MKIYFVGDLHGEFGRFNTFINKKSPDVILQCGDNAYFWMQENNFGKIKTGKSKVYLIPGNHENWTIFEKQVGRCNTTPIEIESNLFYCPIGSSIIVEGKKILFIGGADSYDKNSRILGVDWFKEELLNQSDLDYVLSNNTHADIIVSHTCPLFFNVGVGNHPNQVKDPSRYILSIIYEKLNPQYWYFGHFHTYKFGTVNHCSWICLSRCDNGEKWFDQITLK